MGGKIKIEDWIRRRMDSNTPYLTPKTFADWWEKIGLATYCDSKITREDLQNIFTSGLLTGKVIGQNIPKKDNLLCLPGFSSTIMRVYAERDSLRKEVAELTQALSEAGRTNAQFNKLLEAAQELLGEGDVQDG